MSASYLIPARTIESEINVLNSRFIATLGPVFNVDEAKAFSARVRQQYPDATHHVVAYLIGYGNSLITHSTDDGEPSGTAGRPALSVLQGSGFGDIIAVVTRYFGGTKLGTGGLVRAYSDAVKAGLVLLPKARKIATCTVLVVLQYTFLERLRQIAKKQQAIILEENFAADITATIQLPVENYEPFRQALINLTSATAQIEMIESNPATILPL
jgi:uncharacterized YigZ family protein